jgi:hypothetical protein
MTRDRKLQLYLEGMTTITLNQSMSRIRRRSTREALAGDWRAIGNDMRKALGTVRAEVGGA